MSRLRLALLLPCLLVSLSAAPFTGLRDGESFRYRVGWGVFGHAGELRIDARSDNHEGRAVLRITTRLSSRGFVRGVYEFDSTGELLIDAATGRMILARDEGHEGSKPLKSLTTFDYEARKAVHVDSARPGRSREFPMPEGEPVDLISALIMTRDWGLEPGQKRDAVVYFGRDIFPVVMTAEGRETVRTRDGAVEATVLVPRMEKEEPRGVFKRGGEIKVWVSEASPRQPVQMQLRLNFGTVRLALVDHRAPQAAATAP